MFDFAYALLLFAVDQPGRGGGPGKGGGIAIILGTLALIVIAIAVVWTLAAKRGSRMPGRKPQPPGSVGS